MTRCATSALEAACFCCHACARQLCQVLPSTTPAMLGTSSSACLAWLSKVAACTPPACHVHEVFKLPQSVFHLKLRFGLSSTRSERFQLAHELEETLCNFESHSDTLSLRQESTTACKQSQSRLFTGCDVFLQRLQLARQSIQAT